MLPRLHLPPRLSPTTVTTTTCPRFLPFSRQQCHPRHFRLPRLYSTSQSTTFVEAQHIRPALPPNHPIEQVRRTLLKLQSTSHGHSDASRIELALRGIEQESAPVRIAVVGAEILPLLLGKEMAGVTELISTADRKSGRGLLLRFGTTVKLTTPVGSPLSVLTAPIEVLKSHNVELVVVEEAREPLVPVFRARDVPGTRIIEYPVHKTLFYAGTGAEGVVRLLESPVQSEQVLRVVALPGVASAAGGRGVHIIDPAHGETVEGVKEWLLDGTTSPEGENTLKPAVKALLHDIFANARQELAAATTTTTTAPAPIPEQPQGGDTAESIAQGISAWSKAAHLELTESTDAMFLDKDWKLEWWKLLWRVDDVGIVSGRIVETRLLVRSEEGATFLAGRLFGAGYTRKTQVRTEAGDVVDVDELPRPVFIPERRRDIVQTQVPALQTAALRYLLSSLSTAGLSAAFSVLLVLSDVGMYPSLTVAAVGTVGSAGWLQSRWMKERRGFQDAVREKGREAIVESERWAWEKLKAGLKTEVDAEVQRERERVGELGRDLEKAIEVCMK